MIPVRLDLRVFFEFMDICGKRDGTKYFYLNDCITEKDLFTLCGLILHFKSEEDYVFAVMKYSELFENHTILKSQH